MSRVSVLLPFFDAERFLDDAIQSVFGQTWRDWELVMIDDGSTDGSRHIAECALKRASSQVTILEHAGRRNRGLPASRNLGLSHARGQLIALIDADDVWERLKLEQQVALLDQYPDAGWVYGSPMYWHSWTGDPGDRIRDNIPGPGIQTESVHGPPSLLAQLYPLGEHPAPCPSDMMFRREALTSVGGFEESFTGTLMMYEDQALLAKLYLTESVYVSAEPWTRYRVHAGQMTTVMAPAYHKARRYFLEWLDGYLRREGVLDPSIDALVRRCLQPYHHPFVWIVTRLLGRLCRTSAAMHRN